MGYACPVCATPQADERHLADHLALTAMVHGDDHESWLDEHVEGWSSMGPEDLGPIVAERATETEYEEVFEDTTGGGAHLHDHGSVSGNRLEDEIASQGRRGPDARGDQGRGSLTTEQQSILEEAQEMTREMMADAAESDADEDEQD